jgi:hypothetical protein
MVPRRGHVLATVTTIVFASSPVVLVVAIAITDIVWLSAVAYWWLDRTGIGGWESMRRNAKSRATRVIVRFVKN